MKICLNLYLILFLCVSTLVLSQSFKDKLSPELRKDVEELESVKRRTQIVSCLVITRNSLTNNDSLKKYLKTGDKLEKEKNLAKLLNYCVKNIKSEDIEEILQPDTLLTNSNENLINRLLLKFDKNYSNEEEENQILKELNEINNYNEHEGIIQEEEIGLFGFKISEIGSIQYIFAFLMIASLFIIVFGGLYFLKNKNKKVEKKKKH